MSEAPSGRLPGQITPVDPAELGWPPVISIDTPLPVHLCPEVGRGLLVIPGEATEADFQTTAELLDAVEWRITEDFVGTNAEGAQVFELLGQAEGLVTLDSSAGAKGQLLQRAGLAG